MTCRVALRTPGDDQRQRARHLDLAQHLAAGHAHALGGVAGRRIDLPDAGVGAGQDRRDGEEHEHDHAGDDEGEVAGIFGQSQSTTRRAGRGWGSRGAASARLTTRMPRPVWPIAQAERDGDDGGDDEGERRVREVLAGRCGMPSGPDQCAGSVSQPTDADQRALLAARCHGVSARAA